MKLPFERRNNPRVPVDLTCYQVGARGRRLPVGRCANISRGGALLLWYGDNGLPSIGDDLVLEVELPANRFGQKFLRLRVKVVRICATTRAAAEVAAVIENMMFRGGAAVAAPDWSDATLREALS